MTETVRITRRGALTCMGAGALCALPWPATAQPVALMLAQHFTPGLRLADWGVSEKYDGLRGYWDGHALWTRGGEKVAAPPAFTAGWPARPLDGELWAGRGRFEAAVSAARTQVPDARAWRGMRFMAFDAPAERGAFRERHQALGALLRAANAATLMLVAQQSVADEGALERLMRQTVKDGGEGLVLHRWDSAYRAGRSPDLLKYKPHEDADARVIGHVPGRGKYAGMMGALQVETPEGLRFKLGTGFDDAQRRQPPPVGSWVSFRHRGETDAGVPRFASFLRVRADLPR